MYPRTRDSAQAQRPRAWTPLTQGRAALFQTRPTLYADTIHSILSAALMTERLTTTLYYQALTTPAILRDSRLCGLSADPNRPGQAPNGAPQHVRFLQAALDAEVKHAALLTNAGAVSPHREFYFPPMTFARLGLSTHRDSFLGVLEMLEAASVAMYIAAAGQFARLGRHDLTALAGQIMGIEAEHRALGRVIAGMRPPNNLTLETASFTHSGAIGAALHPFLTGERFPFADGATKATMLPSRAQTAYVVGKYGTRRIHRFL